MGLALHNVKIEFSPREMHTYCRQPPQSAEHIKFRQSDGVPFMFTDSIH